MRFLRPLIRRLAGERGQSIIEALVAVAVLGIAAESAVLVVRAMARQNVSNRDRIFATEKALHMLEELRGLTLTNGAVLTTLDAYSDGMCNTCTPVHPNFKWTLTTKEDVTSNTTTSLAVPDYLSAIDPHSANPVRPSGFAFVRYVDVRSTTRDADMRMIYVRVYAAAPNPGPVASTQTAMPLDPAAAPLAEVYGVVHSQGAVVTPDQVLDVYFIALENVPGWWSRTSNLIPLMESSVVSLQAMNPGLIIRPHWIRTMSFGRDLEYTPEINAELQPATATAAFQKAYVYPGYVDYDYGGTDNDYYYLPSWFLGRVNVGGALPGTAGWPSDMSVPNLGYAMADQFNQAMRYPDEANLYQVLTTIAINQNQTPPQMSWRMLLEKLNDNDPSVQNAIIINLHGEMVPVPPLRNYSDAAKDPDYFEDPTQTGLPGPRAYRAVTQPENLWYSPTDLTEAVNVYAYDANPNEIATSTGVSDTVAGTDAYPGEVVNTITLFVPGATLANLYQIYRTQGNSQTPYYRFVSGVAAAGGGFQYYPSSGTPTVITDSPDGNQDDATFWADDYQPPYRAVTGLRIQLYGTTATARPFVGSEYSLTPSP
ncbi:MAG: type IV pilus modification PilV family protein [bacterium]